MAESLPTEVWIQICEALCICCEMPKHANSIPDFRLTSAREGKAALRAMCLVSHNFKDMSQCILFHYFLNCSKGGNLGFQGTNDDRVPSFLRTLISNPSLGSHVRIITLFHPPYQRFHDITRKDLQAWSRVSAGYDIRVPGEVLRALAGKIKASRHPRLVFDEPGPNAHLVQSHHGMDGRFMWFDMTISGIYEWLNLLTLNLVPQVTHLQLTRPLRSLRGLQMPPRTFPQLRVVTYDMYTRMEDVISSHACFPDLETLDARDFSIIASHLVTGPNPMMNIRKLSISCTPQGLLSILPLCPLLEDLACHCSRYGWHGQVATIEWPAHTKNTLRRLAWANEDASRIFRRNRPQRLCIPPLSHFERLEVLEIDQSSLLVYCQLLEAETLSSVLPKTLRVLHIAFARDVLSQLQIARQLRKLAYANTMDITELSIVRVDDPPRRRARMKTLAEFMEATGVLSVMNEAGIALQIRKEAPRSYYVKRSILSQPPGAGNKACNVIFQHELFSLDDTRTCEKPARSGAKAISDEI